MEDDVIGWPKELACFRCGARLMPEVKPGELLKMVVLVEVAADDRRVCCKECVRAGDHVV